MLCTSNVFVHANSVEYLNVKILVMFSVKNEAMKRQSCVMKDVYQ